MMKNSKSPDQVVPETTPFDWSSAPTGRNYLHYGRAEMDAFNKEIKAHVDHLNALYAAAITLLARTREEVKAERSNAHHFETLLEDGLSVIEGLKEEIKLRQEYGEALEEKLLTLQEERKN